MARMVFDDLEREFRMRKRARRKEYAFAAGCIVLVLIVSAAAWLLMFG